MIIVMLLALEKCSPDDKYLKALMQRSSSLRPEMLIEILMKKKKNRLAVIAALNKEMQKKRGDTNTATTSLIGTPYDGDEVIAIPGIPRKEGRKGQPYTFKDLFLDLAKKEYDQYVKELKKERLAAAAHAARVRRNNQHRQ